MREIEFKVLDYIDWEFIKSLEKIDDPQDFIDECHEHIDILMSDVIGENKLFHTIPTEDERNDFIEDVAFILTRKGMILHDEYIGLLWSIVERKFPDDTDWMTIPTGLID